MSAERVRIAICDDSRSYTEALRSFLEADRSLQVVAIAHSAEELIAELPRARPDLVTIDLELPGIDGVEAIRRIMATQPLPIVVLSTQAERGGGALAAAIAAGALDAVAKSQLRLDRRSGPRAIRLRQRLAQQAGLGSVPTLADTSASAGHRAAQPQRPSGGGVPKAGVATVVGVAASAGGPAALAAVLGSLPADYALPLLVVQHMSRGFTAGLVRWLDATVPPPVRLARAGEPAGSGVAVAPDDAHLLLGADGRLQLDARADGSAHRPSADVLLSSLARSAGRGAVAVVLTGMGRDGAAGVAAVCEAGGAAIAERADRALLSSMPAAAAEGGATPLELAQIGPVLALLSAAGPR